MGEVFPVTSPTCPYWKQVLEAYRYRSQPLTDGRHHAVLITDDSDRLVGLVTQTDMIVALARLAASRSG